MISKSNTHFKQPVRNDSIGNCHSVKVTRVPYLLFLYKGQYSDSKATWEASQ